MWDNKINLAIFIALMILLVRSGLTAAFNRGAADVGIQPSELTGKEIAARDEQITINVGALGGFADAILAGNRLAGGLLRPLQVRGDMWINSFGAVRALASRMAGGDLKLMWIWNPLKDHCGDCTTYNGRVYRASVWNKVGVEPKSRDLECQGYRCGGIFAVTDEPAFPGRPPAPGQ